MQVKSGKRKENICDFKNSELSFFFISLTPGQEKTIITFLKLLINSDLKTENRFLIIYFATL